MKKGQLLVLGIGAVFALASCNQTSTSSEGNSESAASSGSANSTSTITLSSDNQSSSETSSSSSVVAVRLSTPVFSLTQDKTGLTWAPIANAVKYQIAVNAGDFADATAYTFTGTVGKYVVSLKAIGDGSAYLDSEVATWSYDVKDVSLSDITLSGMTASWTAVGYKTQTAFAPDGNIVSSLWADSVGSSYTASQSGKFGVVVNGGYDETANINYVGDKVEKYLFIVSEATENKVILNNESDVADDLSQKTYLTSSWEDAGAHSAVSISKADIEEAETSIDFNIQQLSNAYQFGYSISGLNSYKGVSTNIKGDGKSSVYIKLQMGGAAYATFNAGILNSNWHHLSAPFSDVGWKVNGTSTTLADFALSQGFADAGATLFAVTEIDVGFKTAADAAYAFTHLYMKDLTLVADGASSELNDQQSYQIAGTYTGKNASNVVFSLVKSAEETYHLASLNLYSNLSADLAITKDGSTVTFKTADDGASLTYVGNVTDKGRVISFSSASGTYGSYFQQVNFNYVYMVDDFETYADTETLTAAYYTDTYTGSGSSIIGGGGWQAVGEVPDITNYLSLDSTEGDAFHGKACAALQANGTHAIRHSTKGLTTNSALAWPKADTFSFWMKNPAAVDLTVRIRFATGSTVSSLSNVTDSVTVTIPASSGWTQYTVPLSLSKAYYGVLFMVDHTPDYGTYTPLVDAFEIFTDANPQAAYVDPSPIPAGTKMMGTPTATITSCEATFAHDSGIAVDVIDALGGSHSLTGTYTIDANNNIAIDCGADLNFVGVVSPDKSCIKYTSATGTLGSYVTGLFLQSKIADKTRIESYERMTETDLENKITIDQDANNSGSFATLASSADKVSLDTTAPGAGFGSAVFNIDTTYAKIGKYRYRWAQASSLGKFTNISFLCKNTSSLALTIYLYMCSSSGTSSSGRVQTSVNKKLNANSGWTVVTAGMGSASNINVYGFSFFVTTDAALTTDVVSGSFCVDDVVAW